MTGRPGMFSEKFYQITVNDSGYAMTEYSMYVRAKSRDRAFVIAGVEIGQKLATRDPHERLYLPDVSLKEVDFDEYELHEDDEL